MGETNEQEHGTLHGIIRVDINILHAPKYHIPWEFYYSSIAHADEQ